MHEEGNRKAACRGSRETDIAAYSDVFASRGNSSDGHNLVVETRRAQAWNGRAAGSEAMQMDEQAARRIVASNKSRKQNQDALAGEIQLD